MPRFTRMTYELVAETLAAEIESADLYEVDTLRRTANRFARYFEADNPEFNYTRFLRAAGIIGSAVRCAQCKDEDRRVG